MLMMLGAHPMLAKSTKALNQAQIDGLRASRVQNRFCVKLLNCKKIHENTWKISLVMIILSSLTDILAFKFKKSRFRIFRAREQERWMFLNGNCPHHHNALPIFWRKKRSLLITFWARRPSFDSVSFHPNLISPGFVFTSWSLVMCSS